MYFFGVTIDKDLIFNRHISQICEKDNKQFCVLNRFKNIISRNVMLRLYKAFVLPHLQYCSLIWHCCGTRNCVKLESLSVFQDIFLMIQCPVMMCVKESKDSIFIQWKTLQNTFFVLRNSGYSF